MALTFSQPGQPELFACMVFGYMNLVTSDTLPFGDNKFSTENPWEKKGNSWELTVKKGNSQELPLEEKVTLKTCLCK